MDGVGVGTGGLPRPMYRGECVMGMGKTYAAILILVLVPLSVVMVAAKSPTQGQTVPIQVVLWVPRDYEAAYSIEAASAKVDEWTRRVQAWFIREVGLTFDYQLTVVYSTRSIYEMVGSTGGFDYCSGTPEIPAPIPEGWLGTTIVNANSMVYSDAQAAGVPAVGSRRFWVVNVGAGGSASGRWDKSGPNNVGEMLLGDWGLINEILMTPDSTGTYQSPGGTNPSGQGCGWPTNNPAGAFGHEILHSMGVGCPKTQEEHRSFLGDTLDTCERRDLRNNNRQFLREP